jgi:hypothetical protein
MAKADYNPPMLAKKLITIAGALGILACGACFIPVQPERPPLPPQRADLQGVHSIHVVVRNISKGHHLNSDELERQIADDINSWSRSTSVRAHTVDGVKGEDAVLDVDILSESASEESSTNPDPVHPWDMSFSFSATLAKTDGEVIWRETAVSCSFTRAYANMNADTALDGANVRYWANYFISRKLIYEMFSKK